MLLNSKNSSICGQIYFDRQGTLDTFPFDPMRLFIFCLLTFFYLSHFLQPNSLCHVAKFLASKKEKKIVFEFYKILKIYLSVDLPSTIPLYKLLVSSAAALFFFLIFFFLVIIREPY